MKGKRWHDCRDTLCILVAIVLAHVGLVWCATHWVSTHDNRIYATQDSYFNLAEPHDLIQLLKQEQRVYEAHDPKRNDEEKKSPPDAGRSPDQPDAAVEFARECADFDTMSMNYLLTSSAITLDKLGFDMETFIGPPTEPTGKKLLQPNCNKFLKLPFSMAAFEHLSSMVKREDLSVAAEEEIAPLLHPGWKNTSHFGHAVTLALKENANSWVLYNLATFFWRVLGNAPEAVECARRALHLTPRRYLAVPMLNLANLLVAADQDEDAIVVLDALVTLNDTIAAVYCKAAEAYAATHNYNASLFAFEACLLLDDNFPGARQHRQAVSCFIKQQEINTRSSFERELHNSIGDLAAYQSKLLDFRHLHERILNAMADPDVKRQASLAYDWFTYGQLQSLRCRYLSNKQEQLHCHVDEWDVYKLVRENHHEQLYSKTFKYYNRPNAEKPFTNAESNASDAASESESAEAYVSRVSAEALSNGWQQDAAQTATPHYPLTDKDHLFPGDFVFEDTDWPSKQLCQKSFLPTRQQLPRLFQSPSDMGYNVSLVLTDRLQLSANTQHLLPWYPPVCTAEGGDMDCCDHLLGVQRANKMQRNAAFAELSLSQTLLNLTGTPSDSVAEIGQRILTAMKTRVSSPWLLHWLAALYWRVQGHPAEASHCLRLVLSDKSAADVHDAALLQLAQIVELAGDRVDDAIVLLKQAIELNQHQPWAHYLMSHYLIHNNNLTGAASHLLAVLNIDPLFPGALQVLKAVKCQLKRYADQPSSVSAGFGRSDAAALPSCAYSQPLGIHLPGMPSFPVNTLGGWPRSFFCVGRGPDAKCFMQESATCPLEPVDPNQEAECSPAPIEAVFVLPVLGHSKDLTARYLGTTVATAEDDDEEDVLAVDSQPVGHRHSLLPRRISLVLWQDEDPGIEMTLDHDNSPVWQPSVQRQPLHQPHSQTIVQYAHTLDLPSKAPKGERTGMSNARSMLHLDSALPEVLPRPALTKVQDGANYVYDLPSSSEQCAQLNARVDLEAATSTWLSVSAKGVKLEQLVDFNTPVGDTLIEPICPEVHSTIWTMDHLAGYTHRNSLSLYKPERGLKDAFEKLGNGNETMQLVATRLAQAMRESQQHSSMHDSQDGGVHWALTTVAALYWRVNGHAPNAITCLRHSLKNAPEHMRDLALVSLANVYHQAGMLHSALIAGAAALNLSPDFVVIHFTLANIYSAMGSLDLAMQFYLSTLSRQHNFEPARERIRAIYCITNRLPTGNAQ